MHNHHWPNGLTVWPRVQAPDNRIHTVYIFTYQIPNPQTMRDNTIIVQYIAWLGRDKQDRERLSVFTCGPWRVRRGPCDLKVVTKNGTHKLRGIHQGPPGHSQGRGQLENPEGGGDTATAGGTRGRAICVLFIIK